LRLEIPAAAGKVLAVMAAEIASNGLGSGIGEVSLRAPVRRATKPKPRAKARAGRVRKPTTPPAATAVRTSEILRGLLESKEKSFSVQKILGSLGTTSFGTSLMVFAVPEVLPIPIPGLFAIVVIPTGIISAQMAMGKKEITLPKWLLKRSVPRKPLAGAIRAILPVLERLERIVKPRWKWMTSSAAKKFLGAFILFLSGLMALPIPGTNMPLAISIFVIALGLVERDGAMITAGILIGLASMALLGGIFAGLMALFGRIFA
jgi:hypothetical protein